MNMRFIHCSMAYIPRILVYILLIFGQQHISEAKSEVFSYLGNVYDVFKKAMAVSDAMDWLDNKLSHVDSKYQHDTIEEKIHSMNLQFETIRSDISYLESGLYAKLEETDKMRDLNNKINELIQKIDEIDFLYNQVVVEVNPNTKHEVNVTNGLIEEITNAARGMNWRLHKIHDLLLKSYDGRYILKSLADKFLASRLICQKTESLYEMIHNLFKRIAIAEIQGYAMLKWAFGRLQENSNKTTTHVEEAKHNLITRLSTTLKKVKDQLNKTSRDIYQCDPNPSDGEDWNNGHNYGTFGSLFQKYILNTNDHEDGRPDECRTCSAFNGTGTYCRSKLCEDILSKYTCRGIVRDCVDVSKRLDICRSTRHDRRYEYVTTYEQVTFGRKMSCEKEIFPAVITYYLNIKNPTCFYCFCTCEQRNVHDTYRYFDVREITSDIDKNKIITGANLIFKENTYSIKIWQGELEPNGYVNKNEEKMNPNLLIHKKVEWNIYWRELKSIFTNFSFPNITILANPHDYYFLEWDNRTFCLDDLHTPSGHVLTGIKFEPGADHIKLAVRVTPFEFSTGKLQKEESKWISNRATPESRTELNIENLDVPIFSHENVPASNTNQYLKLTTTGLEQDVGQNVVPFVDLQPIAPNPSVPLGGAGLMYKTQPGNKYGGFLALKLITYDFTPHLLFSSDSIE